MKLVYAVASDGTLIHVSDALRGKSCECVCPGCGKVVLARKGEHKRHHFAHVAAEECSSGYQTALHLAAKRILEQERQIMCPRLQRDVHASDQKSGLRLHETVAIPAKLVRLDALKLETRVAGKVPDLLAEVGGRQLAVEIAVSHFVDDEKVERLMAAGIAVLEVDLSEMDWWTIDDAVLRRRLVEEQRGKNWRYNPRFEARVTECQRRLQDELTRRAEQAYAEHLRARQKVPGFDASWQRFLAWRANELSVERKRLLAEEGRKHPIWLEVTGEVSLDYDSPLSLIDLEVEGEEAIQADRRVWQGGLLLIFVQRLLFASSVIYHAEAVAWIKSQFGELKLPDDLWPVVFNKDTLLTPAERKMLPSVSRAVRGYFHALSRTKPALLHPKTPRRLRDGPLWSVDRAGYRALWARHHIVGN